MIYTAVIVFEVYTAEVEAADLYAAVIVIADATPYGLVGLTALGAGFAVVGRG